MTGVSRFWPDEQVKDLTQMWMAGYSAKQIGDNLGKTRNAVIGKVHRLGLERVPIRSNTMSARPPLPRKHKRGQTNFNFSIGQAKRPKASLPPMHVAPTIVEPLNGSGVTILELKRDQCHAVIKEGNRRTSELARYCGNPVTDEGSYCAGHHAAFHRITVR